MEAETKREKAVDKIFLVSVVSKGIFSFLELVAGIVTIFLPLNAITSFIIALSEDQLADDPDSFFAAHALHAAATLQLPGQAFIAFYLISRGFLKFLLVVALLRKQYWAYPASIALLLFFMAYQVYKIALDHSIALTLLTIFDVVVVWSIWREWKILKRRNDFKPVLPA